MKIQIPSSELDMQINKNFEKLHGSYYSIENIFDGDDADWPGDKEGRALLAFVSHYKMTSRKIPCMELMIEQIPDVTSGKLYFGHPSEDVLLEQQLSGESWYLRGLCEYYEQFGDKKILNYLDKTFNEVYLPTKGRFNTYPINRQPNSDGGAGTDTCVSDTTDTLKVGDVYEAFFCCSMRLAEGLWYITQNKDLLYADTCGSVKKDSCGRYTDGDIIYAQIPE